MKTMSSTAIQTVLSNPLRVIEIQERIAEKTGRPNFRFVPVDLGDPSTSTAIVRSSVAYLYGCLVADGRFLLGTPDEHQRTQVINAIQWTTTAFRTASANLGLQDPDHWFATHVASFLYTVIQNAMHQAVPESKEVMASLRDAFALNGIETDPPVLPHRKLSRDTRELITTMGRALCTVAVNTAHNCVPQMQRLQNG